MNHSEKLLIYVTFDIFQLNEYGAETTILYIHINENEVQIGDGENISLKFHDYEGPLTIPPNIENKHVTSIGNNAFFKCNITSISLPDSIKYIGENSFRVTKITQFISPSSLKTIGNHGFGYISSLKFVDLRPSKSQSYYYERIFFGSNIENALLSDDLTTISVGMFGHTKLKNITIAKRVKYINNFAFWGCQELEEFISESPYFITFSKALYSKDLKTLIGYPSNSFVDILPTTRVISAARGFSGTSFIKFIFNVSISTLGMYAFRDCFSLEFVDMTCTKIKSIEHATFYNCYNLKQIILPESLKVLRNLVFGRCPIDLLILPRNIISTTGSFRDSWAKEVAFCGINDIPGTILADIIVRVTPQYQVEQFMNHSIASRDFVCPAISCTTLITDIDIFACPTVEVYFNFKIPFSSTCPFLLF
ncbi:surface antigen Bsp, putative [Trichomonas vaginalis G3]|uniref:Surface antigen Bsp, putative n=1 Tax=Trichomonas vaginalis (strain ATCC PRA-98 / G3) TaxID=412133 RepID=A2DYZ7_TRIV3|nr:ribonuclease inhibitor domain-containing protein [Trichomonas vaginalis G3]EAY14408.1 surface antigen Bsp, putative [Trichomonas vaginalis G3]KAI5501233.1 ribonuclease inhibitor domain-containing protein [Trichomonas vaginalis G3]|eukprot:XP_001326631.1 surface antigen Bsp [Trichomonas vaginalis G3]